MTNSNVSNADSAAPPIKAIYVQVPVGIPTGDGGLEIPHRVFLGGIATETTELELELFFEEYGAVKDVRIVTDRYTGENKGYGFVTFNDDEDISKLLSKRSITMKGKRLRVRKAVRRNGSQFANCHTNANGEHPTMFSPPAEQYIMLQQHQNAPLPHIPPQYQQMYPPPPSACLNNGGVSHHVSFPPPIPPPPMQPLYYIPYVPPAQPATQPQLPSLQPQPPLSQPQQQQTAFSTMLQQMHIS